MDVLDAPMDAMLVAQGPGRTAVRSLGCTLVVHAVTVDGRARRAVLQGRDVYRVEAVA
ncbi:MAG: hypothetical protein AVDCRST_MAG07-3126 [uncultured Frankineae bacterium]|uniref:Uncharacterized protein n=1 Tax=uncultured Frankineae bacterium TaxID=437475 RepID=A0A6J4M8R8_9ACTN|nr:MAG: hypothetical protein AVDCRST_MAG07-3126 [uncultured Frankineae bacterium]